MGSIFMLKLMKLFKDNFYHLYNRSNNKETLFHEKDNYHFFLNKYRKLDKCFDTIAYCLMPTHFHFLIKVISDDQHKITRTIGDTLSGYTKAINKRFNRTGSLFQLHTKAKLIKSQKHLTALLHYIHQNPVHSRLVNKLEDWEFSSYSDYIGIRNGTRLTTKEILALYKNIDEFIEHSNMVIDWDLSQMEPIFQMDSICILHR